MPTKEFIAGHEVKLVHGGEEYFHVLIDLIRSAKNIIHLQVYIFDDDETGKLIIKELKAAVARKVRVYLMVDGFGSLSLKREFRRRMKSDGIFFRYFSPLPFPGITQAGRRLHHKVCIVDEKEALVGGINIADKYRGTKDVKPWLDYAILVRGYVCKEIQQACNSIWSRRFIRKKKDKFQKKPDLNSGVKVRMSQNDWFRRKNEISVDYKYMLGNAKQEIIIAASYFIPTRKLMKILLRAAKRGRKVKLILAHDSDVPFIKGAMNYLYDKILQQGIRVYEYKEAVLHAKVCVTDREWVSIGSHNLNHLSEFISVEMNIEVLDKSFAVSFASELMEIIENKCVEIKYAQFSKKVSVFNHFFQWLSFRSVSLVQRLLYMLNRREGKTVKRNKKSGNRK